MSDNFSSRRLLIIEDDPQLGIGLSLFLEADGYEVTLEVDGETGLRQAVSMPGYDLILLDAKLPDRSGFEVLREMRIQGASTPVLILTGLVEHEDIMRGFELGADDYLTKPFSTEELLARIHAILRRTQMVPEEASGRYRLGGLLVDLSKKTVTRDDTPIDLTDLEFKLLRYLILHRGRTATREQILRDVWKLPSTVETRTIDRHVNALRSIMDGDDEETWPIKSVYGIGYKLIGAERI
ncbi:MAG: response regulator transcription factor [Bacteroidetes bacterium]|nr:response regulator transcription factor [Bacteroidota bacterium]